MNNYSLVEICKKYNLTSENGATDKESYHKYCSNFYDEYFLKYKHKSIKILEIGVLKYGSLILWDHYFTHPDTEINGVDMHYYESNFSINNLKRVKFSLADAYSKEFVNKLPNFDIIIDDGPHTKQSQIDFINLYLPKVNTGGLLIIEDILEFNWVSDYSSLISPPSLPIIFDVRKISGVPDSLLFVVKK